MNKKSVQLDLSRFNADDQTLIRRAHDRAAVAHLGQRRKSGQPYLTHPVAVAQIVLDWGLDAESVAVALLHDTVEDTTVTSQELAGEFGESIARLVDGLTKLTGIERLPQPEVDSGRLDTTNENLRKLLLASTEDLRVLLIKLADRRHNLQTLGYLAPDKRRRIARESLEIYAPLADRLGMGRLKAEIEDLSFRHFLPEEYTALERRVRSTLAKADRYIVKLRHEIETLLDDGGVTHLAIDGRRKHLYSIHQKLTKTDGDLDKVYDLIAVRLIVPDEAACYQALGLIHQRFRPLIYRIKDYIAVPKPNGYRSLHTTVFAADGRITEIQIRTPQMHTEAELGLAAHFHYDAQKGGAAYRRGQAVAALPQSLAWVKQLGDLRQGATTGQEFIERARLELFSDRIYVFSPKGDLYELPDGATPVDFAFAVHSLIGLRTLGAKVNGKLVTLDSRLENRDVVEILTRRQPAPNRDWLGFVQTTAARNRIRSWFRAASRDTNVASGRTALEGALKPWGYRRLEEVPKAAVDRLLDDYSARGLDDIVALIGEGAIPVSQVLRRLFPPESARPLGLPVISRPLTTGRVLVEGTRLPYTLAPCCGPVFPQELIGYVTRGKGVTVHRHDCRNLPAEPARLTACRWELEAGRAERLVCQIEATALNRVGLLRDLTSRVARRGLNIAGMQSRDVGESESIVRFQLEVGDLYELAEVIRELERVSGVRQVAHLNP